MYTHSCPAFMSCACVHVCHSHFLLSCISLCHTLFPFLYVHMGSDVWMRPLGPVAAEGAAWLHFHSFAEALRFLNSEAGGSLQHLKHTPVARAAKSDGTRDGYSFTFKEPASMVVARPARPQPAATPTLASFGLTAVRCACCGANICGRGRAGKKSPRQAKFQTSRGWTSVAVKKKTPKVEKVPGWVGCFWGPKFPPSRGGFCALCPRYLQLQGVLFERTW